MPARFTSRLTSTEEARRRSVTRSARLAERLIGELAATEFHPELLRGRVREAPRKAIDQKVAGGVFLSINTRRSVSPRNRSPVSYTRRLGVTWVDWLTFGGPLGRISGIWATRWPGALERLG